MPGGHQRSRSRICNHGNRDAILVEFPGGESRALIPGTGFGGKHTFNALAVPAPDHAQGSSVAAGGKGTGVAMGQHSCCIGQNRTAQFAHAEIGLDILFVNGSGMLQ